MLSIRLLYVDSLQYVDTIVIHNFLWPVAVSGVRPFFLITRYPFIQSRRVRFPDTSLYLLNSICPLKWLSLKIPPFSFTFTRNFNCFFRNPLLNLIFLIILLSISHKFLHPSMDFLVSFTKTTIVLYLWWDSLAFAAIQDVWYHIILRRHFSWF